MKYMSKKLITIISSGVALIGLVTSLLLLIPNECEHEYDHACDTICNLCEEERTIEHDWTTPDVDKCEVQSTCSRCGATEGENKEHVYDNDCDVACNECNKTRFVQHDYSIIQSDGTYHWYDCSICERPDGENKVKHIYDNDCDITCNTCEYKRTTEHSPNEDDGDCTTEITCSICSVVTTPAKSVHIPNGDDNDCSTAVSCSVCNQIIIEAKNHDFSGTWEKDANDHWHVCKNDGCTVTDTKVNHSSDGAATEEKAEKCLICDYIICPELEHTHKHNIANYNNENHWIECACGDKSAITVHTSNDDDGDCTTAVTCSGCAYVTIVAKTSHEAGEDDGNCTTPIICKYCTKIAVAGNIDHAPNLDDGDCTTPIDCMVCGTIITPATDGHSAEPDDGDCTTEIKCVTCEKVLVAARNEHTGGMATCGAKAVCEFCNTPYGELDHDNHPIIDGTCACGEKWYINATKMTAEQLNAGVTEKLEAGETDIEIVLAPDAPAEMITAIRRAICDTEGVADGSINLTLKGVTVIPNDPNHEGVGFAERWGQWDENNVEIVTDENVTQLASINLPDVLIIGAQAFGYCENLTFITAPKVQTIGYQAFIGTALTAVEFPELTTIPYALFAGTSTLTSAKFLNVTVVENGGLLIGRVLTESFLLELTTEGDITFNGDSHFNISSQNYSNKVDLVLHANKRNEVTFNNDDTATWKGYTFKSISFACLDGTTNHDYKYFDNGDGTHNFGCTICDDEIIESHTIVDGKCECGAMEITIGTASIARWVNDSVDEQRMLVEGDSFILHLFNKDDPTKTEVHTVSYDGEKWNTIISSIIPSYFVAYIGDGVTVTSPTEYFVESFISNKDQSTSDSFNADDVVIATGDISVDGSLDLFFEHQYAKVTFNVELASQFDSMKDYISEFYVVTYDGYYVNPYVRGNSYSAVIPANPYFREGVHFALVTINGEIFEIEIPNEYANPNGSLSAGVHYTFDYKLGIDKIIVNQIFLKDIDFLFGDGWNNEEDLRSIEIGNIQDIGKTAWEDNDQIIVSFTSKYYGPQIGVLTFYAGEWIAKESLSFSYLENETPVVSAFYAPCYDIVDDGLIFKDGIQLGMTEYFVADCVMDNLYSINVDFSNVIRDYSRLRIVGQANTTYTVDVTDFTPAGEIETGTYTYTITTDGKGNAYLYGVFSEDATVTVKKGDVILTSFIFSADKTQNGTEYDKSYALEARAIIDGTFGGKSEVTYEDVDALVELLKAYVDNGITTIIVTGSEPSIIYSKDNVYMPAVPEALYQLSGGGYYEENNPYYGTIDLIMLDTTEVAEWEFFACYVLNSISLPKVTTIGDGSFAHCTYLKKITFGSVINCIIQEHTVVFYQLGREVGGCDLVLNCEQLQAEVTYKPDLVNNVWFRPSWGGEVTWNSITIIHTGECDDCKANN